MLWKRQYFDLFQVALDGQMESLAYTFLSLSSSSEAHHLRAVTFVKLLPLSCRSAVSALPPT